MNKKEVKEKNKRSGGESSGERTRQKDRWGER